MLLSCFVYWRVYFIYFWFFSLVVNAELLWLESDPNTKLMRKDCINAFVGGIRDDSSNVVMDWIRDNNVQQVHFCSFISVLCLALLEGSNQF